MSMFAGTPDVDADIGEPECSKHGEAMSWQDCSACADGFQGHDCGEDCCPCLNPEDNVLCDTCGGNTGWWLCGQCAKEPPVEPTLQDVFRQKLRGPVDR